MNGGHANYGITTAKGIIEMIQQIQTQGIGRCSVNTFGFGPDHDANLLTKIAEAEGMYYFIEAIALLIVSVACFC